ncbi:MAG TPA: M23 family metallopeptidase [Thermoleophilaceae bacterium]|nr:M23 family metallopeptidase [Thermoleophilaceae bacterium]
MTLGKRSIAACALVLAAPSGPALAAETSDAGGAEASNVGGAEFTPTPVIKRVKCIKLCSGKTRVQAGGTVRIMGRTLRDVDTVVFHGGTKTTRDNVSVDANSKSNKTLKVKVPLAADTGPLTAWVSKDVGSEPSNSIAVLPPPPPERSARLKPSNGPRDRGAPRLETGISTTKAFFGGAKVRFSYRINDDEPVPVTIELINATKDVVVRRWKRSAVEPDTIHTIRWNGQAGRSIKVGQGRYIFRVTAQSSEGLTARSSDSTEARRDAFDFYGHIFPIRGRHDYGSSGSRFGSGRSGHSHQGQDVFARCGTKLVAARSGKVKFNQYHSAAGYYVVVDGYKSKFDYVYMHLQKRSPFKAGDRIRTGQMLGRVGETGNAQGCHLHYEMWSAPGWYRGGSPLDPYRFLKSWDRWS